MAAEAFAGHTSHLHLVEAVVKLQMADLGMETLPLLGLEFHVLIVTVA